MGTTMSSLRKTAAIPVAAATAAICFAVGPAAATTVTVSGGPNFGGGASPVTFTAGSTLSCPSGSLSGSVTPGSYTVPAAIASFTSSTWSGCSFGVTLGGSLQVLVTGSPVGGVTPIEIRNFNATLTIPSLGCTLHFAGTAGGNFNNAAQDLTLTGTPTLSVATSGFCIGYTSPGSFTATYHSSGPAVTIS
jgi:hypothetical protein